MQRFVFAVCGLAISASAMAQIDGTNGGTDGYGPAVSVQTTQTQFGDANPNNGSEWNAAYGTFSGGRLNLLLTGNLEANFNKFEIFIDSRSGGQNVYSSAGNDGTSAMNGLTFDSGFQPDYHIVVRRGNDNGNDKFDLDFANLQAGTFSSYQDILGGATGTGSTGTGVNASAIQVAYDNSNTAGVTGGTGPANQAAALAVTTGLELSISLADLGNFGTDLCVWAFQQNQGHNYASNQFLPGLQNPQGNLGGDGVGGFNGSFALNMNNYYPNSDGWFVVPAPGAASLLALGGLAALRRRR